MSRLLVVLLLAGLALAPPAGATALAPFIDLQEAGLTMVTDGHSLQGRDFTQTVDVQVDGPVRFALLYWSGRQKPCEVPACTFSQPYRDQQMAFNGTPITGTVIGTEVQAAGPALHIGYFADVTSLVSAAGTGAKSFTVTDGNGSSNLSDLDGVSLVVAYTAPSDPVFYRVLVWDNLDFADASSTDPANQTAAPVTFGHGAIGARARRGQLTLLAGGGTTGGGDRLDIAGSPFASSVLNGASGPAYDVLFRRINIPAAQDATTAQLFSEFSPLADALRWQLAMLRVRMDGAADAPLAFAGPVNGVEATKARPSGTVNPGGAPSTWSVEYGPSTTYGSSTAGASAGAGGADVPIEASLEGLTPGTTYHWRLRVQTEAGIAETPDQVFTTLTPSDATPTPTPTPTPTSTPTPEACETRRAFLKRQVKRAKGARIRSAAIVRGKRVVKRLKLTRNRRGVRARGLPARGSFTLRLKVGPRKAGKTLRGTYRAC